MHTEEGRQARRNRGHVDHKSGNPAIDEMLADHMKNISGRDKGGMKEQHSAGGTSVHGQKHKTSTNVQHQSIPRSSDIIPALRDLSNEVEVANAELPDTSSLGKRNAEHEVSQLCKETWERRPWCCTLMRPPRPIVLFQIVLFQVHLCSGRGP